MATAQNNRVKPLTDAELHAALKRFEPEYNGESSTLTDDQRQIRVKRLQKYQKKEEEDREKQARKQEKDTLKKGKDSQKSVGLRSPQNVKSSQTRSTEVKSSEYRSTEVTTAAMAAESRAAKTRSAEVTSQARLNRSSLLGVRSVEVRTPEISSQSAVVEPQTKKARGGSRKSVIPEGNVTLQLTPNKLDGSAIVRTETVVQSPPSSKKVMTSSGSTACIEVSVRDVTLGEAANNLSVSLYGLDLTKNWKLLAQRSITATGDCPGLITNDLFEKGLYKLHFDTGDYFQSCSIVPLFPCVEVMFEVVDPNKTYHLHIDLGPYSYTTSISN